MSLAGNVDLLAARIADEINTVRDEIAARYVTLPFNANGSSTWALTNSPAAYRFAGNAIARASIVLPETTFTQVRFISNVATVGISGATVRLVGKAGAWSTTFANWTAISGTDLSLVATGPVDSGWISIGIASCAYLAVAEGGGDAAADPALGVTYVCLR